MESIPQDFSEFMGLRWSRLYRTAYLLTGNAHDAEDLLQEAMARTCLHWSRIRDKAAADGYVRRILAREATRGWRRRGHETVTATPPELPDAGGLDGLEAGTDLWRRIQALPARQRAVLVLRYYEDLTEAQTADALGCSVGTVKSQAHVAIRRLRAELTDADADDNQDATVPVAGGADA